MKKLLFLSLTLTGLYPYAQVTTISQPTPGCCWYSGVDQLAAQSFTITQAGVITEIRFHTQGNEGATTVELREGQNVSGPLLYSTVVNIPGPGWVIVPIPNVVVCEGVYCYTQSGWQWGDQNLSDPYPGGMAYYSGSWSGSSDQVFEIDQIINNEPTSPTVFTNYTVCSGSTVPLTNYTINDESATTVIVTATSSNPSVIPAGNIVLGGSGSSRTISFSAAPTTAGTTTITLTLDDGNCANSYSFNVTVNPIPTVDSPFNQAQCNGFNTAAVIFTGPVGGTTFSWTNSAPSIGLAASGTGSIASFTAINTGTTLVSAGITVTPTAAGCVGPAQNFSIDVYPTPDVIDPPDQGVCNGGATAPVSFSGSVAGTSFSWSNPDVSIGLAATGSGNIPSFTATNSGTAPVSTTITVTPEADGCSGPSQAFIITVSPTPTAVVPGNQTLCSGGITSPANFTGTVAGTTYSWVNDDPSIGLAASGSGDISAFTATNSGTSPVTANIVVTPQADGCVGTAQAFNYTVNPIPDVADPVDQTLCAGDLSAPVSWTGGVAGTVYNWTNSNTTIGLTASGSGNIPSFTATNASVTPITANVVVTPTANGCTGTTQNFNYTVNPNPNVFWSAAPPDLCDNEAPYTLTEGSPVGAGGVYTGPGVSGNSIDPAAALPGTHVLTYTFTDVNGCVDFASENITIHPSPVVSFSPVSDFCEDAAGYTLVEGSPFGGTYAGPGITAGVFDPAAAGPGSHNESYTFTDVNGCTGAASQTITVHALPAVSFSPLADVCINATPFALSGGSPGGGVYTGTGVSGGNFDPAIAGNGTHVITYTFTDGVTGCTDFATSTVLVYSAPAVTANATATSICEGDAVTLTGTGASTYVWDSGVTDCVAFNPAIGTATYTVTGTDANGCQNTDQVDVTVNANPVVNAGADITSCENDPLVLAASGADNYSWSGGVINNTAFVPPVGVTVYTVTGTDLNNCQASDDITITVNPLPVLLVSPDATFCAGDTLTLEASGATTIDWNSGAGTGTSFAIIPAASTTVNVTGTSAGCSATTSIELVLDDPSLIDAGADATVCAGFTTYLVASGGVSYEWNGPNVANVTESEHGFQADTSAWYYLTATTANGCVYTDSLFVTASTDPSCTIEPLTTFSPNGDAVNESWKIQGINAFPDNTVTVINRWGDVVFEQTNYDNESVYWNGTLPNGAEAPGGTYFFVIEITGGPTTTGWIQLLK